MNLVASVSAKLAGSFVGNCYRLCVRDATRVVPAFYERLSVQVKQFQVDKADAPSIICFHQHDELEDGHFMVSLPRAIGFSMFGPSEKVQFNEAAEMGADVKYEGTLRDQQPEAVEKCLQSMAVMPHSAIMQAETGMGKTDMAISIACHLKTQTWVLVHRELLLQQWITRINERAPQATVAVFNSHTKVDELSQLCGSDAAERPDFVVAMMPTMHNRVGKDHRPWQTWEPQQHCGLVIVDECHHIAARTFRGLMPAFGAKFMLGLTATPERRDGLTCLLHWFLGPFSVNLERKNNPVIEETEEPNETHSGMKKYSNLFVERMLYTNHDTQREIKYGTKLAYSRMLKLLTFDDTRTRLLVDRIAALILEGRHVLIFTVLVKVLYTLRQAVETRLRNTRCAHEAGVIITRKHKMKERAELMKSRVIFSTVQLMSEGVDIDHINTVVLTMPLTAVAQPIGRIRLDNEHSHQPLIVDFVDSFSVFAGQGAKRRNVYYSKGYEITTRVINAAD